MPPRIFKRKSNGKSHRNFESNCEESRIEDVGSSRNKDSKLPPSIRENTMQELSTNRITNLTIPNRIFVGGIPASVNEGDLRSRFINYGSIKTVKIIRDHVGYSKGYGFVTFGSEDEAKKAIEKAEVIFKGRKLNIAPAVKRQNHRLEASESFWNSPASSISEKETARKNDMIHSQMSDYPGYSRYEALANAFENPGSYIQSGQGGLSFSSANLQCGYGTPQMNILPYPTVVYVPQQAFQCSGAVPYPINGSMPEIFQFLPAPLCCFNEST